MLHHWWGSSSDPFMLHTHMQPWQYGKVRGAKASLLCLKLMWAKRRGKNDAPTGQITWSLSTSRVCLLTSTVNILYKVIPIRFGKNMFIFVQPNSEREWTEMLRVVKTDLYKFSALCLKLTWLTLHAQPPLLSPIVWRGVWDLRYWNFGLHSVWIINDSRRKKKGHCILKQRFCVFKKGQYCNLEINNLLVNIVRNCVHYTQ